MANEKVLVVDADARSAYVLEVSLRTAGYRVVTATDGGEALAQIESSTPDLVISDTALGTVDGFALVGRLKERAQWASVPIILLTSPKATEDRIRAVELGVDDWLTKPVLVREVVARVRLLLDRRLLEHLAAGRIGSAGRRLEGSTRDIALVNLLQAFELSRQGGVLRLQNGVEQGSICFREGHVVDATLGRLRGEEAVYRALASNEATFEIELRPVANENVIGRSIEALVLEGMRRASVGQIGEPAAATQDEDVTTAVIDPNSAGIRDSGRAIRSARLHKLPTHALMGLPTPPAPAAGQDKTIAGAGAEELPESEAPTLLREEPRTEEVDLSQWLEEPTAETSAEPSFEHERIAGVPRQIRPATKRLVAAVLLGSTVILAVGSLRALRARQERLAEESRTHAASTERATARPIDVPPPPPTAPAIASAQAAESASAVTSATPIDGTVPESTGPPMASAAAIVARAAPVAFVPAITTGATTLRPVAAAPLARETPVDMKTGPGGGSLVVEASRALAKGATAHAVDLAREATAANPGDAEAWLTLAAAYQASGNGGAARAAYASCVAQAKTPNISECRLLAVR